MNTTIDIDKLMEYLDSKDADYGEINMPLVGRGYGENIENSVYDIEVNYGDWKHSHAYLVWLMKEIGYEEVYNKVIYVEELEGSDCYSSVHRFAEKNMMALFNANKN